MPAPAPKSKNNCSLSLEKKQLCEVMHFNYRLNYRPESEEFYRFVDYSVGIEVKFAFTYKRCPGDLVLGDLVYTNTLLPGEKVRLFTSDRRTKFTFDAATAAANRNVQSSEESFQSQQMSDAMFDFTSKDNQTSSYSNKAHVDGHGDAGVDVLGLGGEANMSGNFNSQGTASFADELTQHAQSKHNETTMGTRKAASVSIGETQTRAHTETTSEDHYESSSREFENPNHCHALTFLFHQIDKTYTVQFRLDEITVRVYNNQLDNTRISASPWRQSTGIGILSTLVHATNREDAALATNRIAGERRRQFENLRYTFSEINPLPTDIVQEVTKIVTKELVEAGLLNDDGTVSQEAQKKYSFETQMALPTPGVMIKGSMDDCDICEPAVHESIKLELQNKKLQNQLLQRQIELLDKSQEYRCCPQVAEEDD